MPVALQSIPAERDPSGRHGYGARALLYQVGPAMDPRAVDEPGSCGHAVYASGGSPQPTMPSSSPPRESAVQLVKLTRRRSVNPAAQVASS